MFNNSVRYFVLAGLLVSGARLQAQATADPDKAEKQLREQSHQRILGIIPNFNTSLISDAAPMNRSQKFRMAFRGAVDPFQFVAAGMVAGYEQWQNQFPEYGQGATGYAKRFGASYADSFTGSMFSTGVFPALLRQDPRYFRKGTGKFSSRLLYAISTTVRAKSDKGRWMPNYSNILGNLAAGGISNLYYPSADRGLELTVQRAVIVSAEGALGSILVEFWPDISRKLFKH